MNLVLKRDTYTSATTTGSLYVDGVFECFTLEDTYRELADGTVQKIQDATAIPNGTYPIEIIFSPHFNRLMPHVMNVPQFEGVLIHWGNTDLDTHGCILVGQDRAVDAISNSRAAFALLFPKIQVALTAGQPVTLTVEAI